MTRITGIGQTAYTRRPGPHESTPFLLGEAAGMALADAGLRPEDVDGLAVASFTLAPDRAIDLAVKLAIRPTWIMDSGLGGASGVDMIQHATAAIDAGQASRILIVAGDAFTRESFARLVAEYNTSMIEDYAGIDGFGPNAMFALVTRLQMEALGLTREDYGSLVCHQRANAADNPNAAYREPLSMREYLDARVVADPLTIYDCVPVVSGANAIVLEADTASASGIRVRGVTAAHNADLHSGDGTTTGLRVAAPRLWERTGATPAEVSVVSVYDDYPAMAIAQLIDAGFIDERSAAEGLARLLTSDVRVNGSGGQLSAGQCGAGAGLHGVVDVMTGLRRGRGGDLGFVSGYGMVVGRYGACANALLLERDA